MPREKQGEPIPSTTIPSVERCRVDTRDDECLEFTNDDVRPVEVIFVWEMMSICLVELIKGYSINS